MCVSLSKASCAKKKDMGYDKKEEKTSMPKGMREKRNACQRA
jgi:hypothetical protein